MHRLRSVRSGSAVFALLLLLGCGRGTPPVSAPGGGVAPVPVGGALAIPVAGVHPHQLRDSYHAARAGGRSHRAIDIHAPRGTPVLAAADGTILKLHRGNTGGNAIYHLDLDGRTRYYYAHLDGYVRGLREGQRVYRGEVIGYVGDTGNARRGDYHLHFSIAILDDPRRWWEGASVNPYPILRGEALADR